jgi:predicted ABC-type sugar transport system permease subunit
VSQIDNLITRQVKVIAVVPDLSSGIVPAVNSVVGTLIGALIVGVLRNGLTLVGVDALYQDIATGLLAILAVGVDRFTRRRT